MALQENIAFQEINPAVEMAASSFIIVDNDLIERTLHRAQQAPQRRARVLLHPSLDDSLHEMLIALPQESCDIPHINFKSGKSFHIVYGKMAVMLFTDDGTSVTPFLLHADGKSYSKMIRLNRPYWHTIIPLSDYCVFIETIIGPFTGNQFAPWAPQQINSSEGQHFANKLRSIARSSDTNHPQQTFMTCL